MYKFLIKKYIYIYVIDFLFFFSLLDFSQLVGFV